MMALLTFVAVLTYRIKTVLKSNNQEGVSRLLAHLLSYQ